MKKNPRKGVKQFLKSGAHKQLKPYPLTLARFPVQNALYSIKRWFLDRKISHFLVKAFINRLYIF